MRLVLGIPQFAIDRRDAVHLLAAVTEEVAAAIFPPGVVIVRAAVAPAVSTVGDIYPTDFGGIEGAAPIRAKRWGHVSY